MNTIEGLRVGDKVSIEGMVDVIVRKGHDQKATYARIAFTDGSVFNTVVVEAGHESGFKLKLVSRAPLPLSQGTIVDRGNVGRFNEPGPGTTLYHAWTSNLGTFYARKEHSGSWTVVSSVGIERYQSLEDVVMHGWTGGEVIVYKEDCPAFGRRKSPQLS